MKTSKVYQARLCNYTLLDNFKASHFTISMGLSLMGESNSVVQAGPPLLLQMANGCLRSTTSASSQMCSLGDNVWQRAGHLAPVCAFSSCWQSQLSLPEHIPVMFTSSIPEQFQIKYLPAETNYVDHHSLAMRRLLTKNKAQIWCFYRVYPKYLCHSITSKLF